MRLERAEAAELRRWRCGERPRFWMRMRLLKLLMLIRLLKMLLRWPLLGPVRCAGLRALRRSPRRAL